MRAIKELTLLGIILPFLFLRSSYRFNYGTFATVNFQKACIYSTPPSPNNNTVHKTCKVTMQVRYKLMFYNQIARVLLRQYLPVPTVVLRGLWVVGVGLPVALAAGIALSRRGFLLLIGRVACCSLGQ